ncbi:helix-turn-helix domain-containing protein [Brevibacillus fluminis]|uniref:helix-turn-helix domain-containing protein n=1 Tax=Brevibacillus fluminis TaxID=511487 RepID=UPI0016061BE9|nr:helix-turn-helix transcriptional regulator [Brevibacillus fluminis]
MSYLGENIRRYRKLKGLSIHELAALSKSSPSSISQIETGKRDVTFKLIESIAKALDMEVSLLVTSQKTIKYDHSIEGLLKFHEHIVVLWGKSINNIEDTNSWGVIVDLEKEGELKEIIYFINSNNNVSPEDFCNTELLPYIILQRMRILLWNCYELRGTYEEIKKCGIDWSTTKELISTFGELLSKSKSNSK